MSSRGRDAAKHLTTQDHLPPPTEDYLVPNVNSAAFEKLLYVVIKAKEESIAGSGQEGLGW